MKGFVIVNYYNFIDTNLFYVLYSDLTIKLKDRSLHGHKFVFNARSEAWNDLETELDLSGNIDMC